MAWRFSARLAALIVLCIISSSVPAEERGATFGAAPPVRFAQAESPPATTETPVPDDAHGTSTEEATPIPPAADQPAPETTGSQELDIITVSPTKRAAKKPTKPRKKKTTSGAASAGGATPQTEETTPISIDTAALETAWGPVDGYAAGLSATGTKTGTPLQEIPQSISVVTSEAIRDQGAQNLQDALRYTAGVVADSYGIDSRTDSPIIRGTEANEYLDGLRRTFNYYVYTYRADPYFMERIEILRGPASVLYGQAAVGGIVNSVSKRPSLLPSNEISVDYGTFDYMQARFDSTGPLTRDGKWSYRLTGLARDADTQVNFVDDDRLALQPAITYRPSADTTITLLGHFRKDHTGSTQQFLPHVGTIFRSKSGFIPWDAFVGEPSDRYDTDAASGTLLAEHRFNDAVTLRQSLRYADVQNDYTTTYPGFFAGLPAYIDPAESEMYRIKSAQSFDTQIFNSDTNLEVKFATGKLSHKVLGGFDYSDFRARSIAGDALNLTPFNVYHPDYGLPEQLMAFPCDGGDPVPVDEVLLCRLPDQHLTQAGLYVQDQIRLGSWIAVLGARQDWVDNKTTGTPAQKDQAATYRAGLMYELPFGLTPYVSYAESFIPEVGMTFGRQTFDPREGVMHEVGFKYQRPGSRFAINGALYDIVESNRLAEDPNHIGFSIQTGEVSIRGGELEAIGQITDKLKIIAGYSYTDAVYTGGDQKGFRVETVPEHLASLWAVREFSMFGRKGFSVGAGVRYVGSSWDGTDSLKTPSYTLFDAMFAYETEKWRFQINGTNLGDEEYLTTCLARGDCFRGTSRTVLSSFTYKF